MQLIESEKTQGTMPDRPIECSHCKRAIHVLYKEIVGNSIVSTELCAECPILEQKLHGQPTTGVLKESPSDTEPGLCCSTCLTTLESVKMGNPLGCTECYAVFGDLLISELIASKQIPARLQKTLAIKKMQPIHIGSMPHQPLCLAPSSRLTALNEALNEALKKENYEQAAWLRDQIKALTEKTDEGKS